MLNDAQKRKRLRRAQAEATKSADTVQEDSWAHGSEVRTPHKRRVTPVTMRQVLEGMMLEQKSQH